MAVHSLRAIALEVRNLDQAQEFYAQLLGLALLQRDEQRGQIELKMNERQVLRLWQPRTHQPGGGTPGLEAVRPRGGAHVHYALKIPQGARALAMRILESRGIPYVTHRFGSDDVALYFFDHDLHGIELRESTLYPRSDVDEERIPVRAFQEVVLEFEDLPAAHRRLTQVYGFRYAWGSTAGERAFTAYRFAEEVRGDQLNAGTELFCWDPQIGIADAQPGEHVYLTVTYPAHDFQALGERVRQAGLTLVEREGSLHVRDPERHVFEFQPIDIP